MFIVQVQPRPQGAFYVFIIERTNEKVSTLSQSSNNTDSNKVLFLKGTDVAVEVLQHPFFAKVDREYKITNNWEPSEL